MKVVLILNLLLIICQTSLAWSPGDSQPHIVFVLADDLGNFTILLMQLYLDGKNVGIIQCMYISMYVSYCFMYS